MGFAWPPLLPTFLMAKLARHEYILADPHLSFSVFFYSAYGVNKYVASFDHLQLVKANSEILVN